MVDEEKLGKALLHYTTAELMFILVGIPILVVLVPIVIVGYSLYAIVALGSLLLSVLGGVAAVFFRQSKFEDESYSLPQEIALILSPILATPILSGLAGTLLFALSKRKKQAEEKISTVEEKVIENSLEDSTDEEEN